MRRPGLGAERLIGLFLVGAIGFSPPVLTLFNKPMLVAGIPLLYAFLFLLWLVLVLLAGVVARQLAPNGEAKPPAPANEETPPARDGEGAR
jgi:Na+-transporting methylmalonyl-CoA/oxaloacetate decarboxylase gamma subunit